MSTADQGPQEECEAVASALEATAFEGSVPTGPLARHLASCKRCSDRWNHEVALYSVPPNLKRRVLEKVARESSNTEPADAGSSRERFRAYFGRILGRTREGSEAREIPEAPDPSGTRDDDVLRRLKAGDMVGAATETLRRFGPLALRYLRAVLHDEDLARDAFVGFAHQIWSGLPTFKSGSSLRIWSLHLACVAATNVHDDAWRKAHGLDIREVPDVGTAADPGGSPSDELAELRGSLSPEEESLLALRIDQKLSWSEVAQVLGAEGAPLDERTLMELFERLKNRLARLAREKGIA